MNTQDIKKVAERLKRMTIVDRQALMFPVFWEDLHTLLDLILEADNE